MYIFNLTGMKFLFHKYRAFLINAIARLRINNIRILLINDELYYVV